MREPLVRFLRATAEQVFQSEPDRHWLHDVVVFTRHWIHYGIFLFVFFLALTAAAEGIFAR